MVLSMVLHSGRDKAALRMKRVFLSMRASALVVHRDDVLQWCFTVVVTMVFLSMRGLDVGQWYC